MCPGIIPVIQRQCYMLCLFPSRPLIMIPSLIPGCVQRPSGGWSLVVLNSRACGGTGEVEGEDEAGKEYASYSPALG